MAASVPIAELARLGRTLRAWQPELTAHFDHPIVSNGPTENLNLKIKNTKRIARGYRNFDHYPLRLLLNPGRIREDHSPTRITTRAPRLVAWQGVVLATPQPSAPALHATGSPNRIRR